MERHGSRITSPRARVATPGAQTSSAAEAELVCLRDMEQAVLEFCARCEIRSVHSYERFRAALAGRGCAAA